MKHKIRRAFDLTKPNVLNRVLEEDPAAPKAAPEKQKKKRKLSEGAMQFIATAASIAILIGSLSGGFVYFRNYYASQPGPGGATAGGQLGDGQVPVDPYQTWTTDPPLPTVDYENTEQGLFQRVNDIIGVSIISSSAPLVQRNELVTEDGVEQRAISVEYYGNIYHFRFLTANGALLRIDVEQSDSGNQIPESVAAWIALMDLDPAHFGVTQHAEYAVSLCEAKVNYVDGGGLERYYLVEISHLDIQASYYIDPVRGTIMWNDIQLQPVPGWETLSAADAQELAFNNALANFGSCYLIDCDQTDFPDYRVQLCRMTEDYGYPSLVGMEYLVNAYTAKIVSITEGTGECTEEYARKLVAAYADKELGTYSIDSCDYVFLSGIRSFWNVTVNTGDGEVVAVRVVDLPSRVLTFPVGPVDLIGARDIALGMWSILLENVNWLETSLDGDQYRVYFEANGTAFKYFIDASGTVTYDAGIVKVDPPEDVGIGWKKARDIALKISERSLEEMTAFTWNLSGGYYYVELSFPEGVYSYQVDAYTGEPLVDLPVPPTGLIAEEEAIKRAVDLVGCTDVYAAGKVEEITCIRKTEEDSSGTTPVYYVNFRVDDIYYEVGINAYDGSSMWISTWALGVTPPRDQYDSIDTYLLGAEPGRNLQLEIRRRPGVRHYSMTDPETGENMDYFPPDSMAEPILERTEAMKLAAQQVGLDTFTSGSVAMQGCFSDGTAFYCVVIPMEDYSLVALMDLVSGEIFYQSTIS